MRVIVPPSSDPPDERPLCGRCGAPMNLRNGRYGPFYGCSRYPRCTFTRSASLVVYDNTIHRARLMTVREQVMWQYFKRHHTTDEVVSQE